MHYKTLIVSMGLVALCAGAGNSYGLGLPKVFNKESSAEASSAEAPSVEDLNSVLAQQESLVKRYVAASAQILTAQSMVAEALGLKEKAAELKEKAEWLGTGSVRNKDALKKVTAAHPDADKEINQKIKEGGQLSKEGREIYAKSFVPYSIGLAQTMDLAPEFQKFMESVKVQLSSAPWTEKGKIKSKLDAGMYVATKMPGHVTTLASTSKNLLTYATSQGIKVPKEATVAIGEPD